MSRHSSYESTYNTTCQAWSSLLNELRVSNINMKLQLTETISQAKDIKIIDKAEVFQQKFVEKDQIIDLLRHDINQLQYQLTTSYDRKDMMQQLKAIDKDIHRLQQEFLQLEKRFNLFRCNH